MPVYIQNDRELRRHVYFGCDPPGDLTQVKGGSERSTLLSPGEFVSNLRTASVDVQSAIGGLLP